MPSIEDTCPSMMTSHSLGCLLDSASFNPVVFGSLVLCAWTATKLILYSSKILVARRWERVCRQVAKERDDLKHKIIDSDETPAGKVDGSDGTRDAEDTRIARLKAVDLLKAMREGKLASERIVAAFSRRAHAIGLLETRSVTQEFYDEALEAASKVDSGRTHQQGQDNDTSVGDSSETLLGIPISVKDTMNMKGALSTCGMACRAALGPKTEDGLIVKVLRSHGAIPFVRGNVPQCLMLPESVNAIWGAAANPWDLSRTPGGSSGGDASLVASRCAPIGIGSDVGGSIRIPAHFTGICGLKPTPDRVTRKGMSSLRENGHKGQQVVQVAAGPLANCVADLELVMSAFCNATMWDGDATVPRLPWDVSMAKKGPSRPLKVGFFTTDGWFDPCPAIKRAVLEACQGLRAAGHEVVPFKPPVSGWEVARLYYGIAGAEGNMIGFVNALEGEKMLPAYHNLRTIAGIPNWTRPILSWVLENVLGERRKASILRVTRNKGLSVRQYWSLMGDMYVMRLKWDAAVSQAGLDAVLYPPAALPALPHGGAKFLTPIFTYTFLANLLHWPSGVVPVTLVREDEQDYGIERLPKDQRDGTAVLAGKTLEGSAGLPVGVQVMCTPFKEELTLHVMQEVERAVGFDAVPPAARFGSKRT